MNILGHTNEGGNIVELNSQEVELLARLEDAMEGNQWSPKLPRGMTIRGDLSKAFQAMIRFVEVKYAVNALRDLVNEIDEAIGVKE